VSHSAAPVASVQFQAESARWYPLTLRAPKKAGAGKRRGKKARGAAGQAGGGAATGSGDADHEEADGTPDAADHGGDAGDLATDGAEPDGEAAATAADGEAAEAPVYPSPRFNAQLAVQRNILYLYGAGVLGLRPLPSKGSREPLGSSVALWGVIATAAWSRWRTRRSRSATCTR